MTVADIPEASFADNCGTRNGYVRLESFQNTFTESATVNYFIAAPVNLFLPNFSGQPSLTATTIGGVPVRANLNGSFVVPDVIINSSQPVTVNISATNIPVGTVPPIHFIAQNFPNQDIAASSLAAVQGTSGATASTVSVTLQPGYSIGYVRANWTEQ